ncbi:MAG: hypothetical protein ACK5WZ_10925 [Pseudobdellovibrionaceae bacterium]|jgi:hypothetical protein
MKKILLLLGLSFVFSVTTFGASATHSFKNVIRGGGNPWPWGQESEFPLDGVQGLYITEIDGVPYMFSLRVIRKGQTIKLLNIRMIDQSECKLVAQGVGVHSKTYVIGALKDINDNSKEFQVSLRVFAEGLLEPGKVEQKYIRNGMVMVVSIGQFGQIVGVDEMTTAPMRKISNNPTKKCEPLQ